MRTVYRTDTHNNPAAFTTDVAKLAGLALGLDYQVGDPFKGSDGRTYYTAHLLGDPIAQTIRVIDKVGYVTRGGKARWDYINLPKFLWDGLTPDKKRDVVGRHYFCEGGTAMRALFPNYGQA